jgi:hypothetical protein
MFGLPTRNPEAPFRITDAQSPLDRTGRRLLNFSMKVGVTGSACRLDIQKAILPAVPAARNLALYFPFHAHGRHVSARRNGGLMP